MNTSKRNLRKRIMKIVTNSQGPNEPKEWRNCRLFFLYSVFSTRAEVEEMKQKYKDGIAWGHMKQEIFANIERFVEHKDEN